MGAAKGYKIGLISLVLLITVSIDSVRNLPSTALFGPPLVFLYLISALFLLIPGSIAASELAYAWPEKGGIYQWVSLGLGKRLGFLAVWGQWINTLVWFPTILAFVTGSIVYLVDPSLANNSHYMVGGTLVFCWLLTIISLFGFEISSRFAVYCSFFGLILPMGFIIVLAIMWIISGNPMQVDLNPRHMLPNFHSLNDWFSLVAIMTSFEGFELVAVHMANMKDPKKNFPKAMLISVILILITMIMGSLAIAIVIPANSIVFVQGVAQAFEAFLAEHHLQILLPILIILMIFGNLGEMINWLAAPARGLFQASNDGFMSPKFHKQNRFGAEKNVLILQALIVTLISLVFLLIPSVNGAYWFLTNLSVEIYMFVYFLLFIAAIIIEFKHPKRDYLFSIFRRRSSLLILVYIMGMIGCVVTLIIGAIPPTNIQIGSATHYQLLFWVGIAVCLLPVIPLYYYQYHEAKRSTLEKI